MSALRGEVRMVSVTAYLETRQRDLLVILSRATKVPVAEYIREGIDKVLQGELPLASDRQLEFNFGSKA